MGNKRSLDWNVTISIYEHFCEKLLVTRFHHCYLLRRFSSNELLVDLLGPRRHSEGRLDLFVVFTGEPKLNILVTEFRFEESSESSQPICRNSRKDPRWIVKTKLQDILYIYFFFYRNMGFPPKLGILTSKYLVPIETKPTFRFQEPFQWLWPLLGIL